MKPTHIYFATDEFFDMATRNEAEVEYQGRRWVPSRPLGTRRSLPMRLYAAWKVFTGQADALVWLGQ